MQPSLLPHASLRPGEAPARRPQACLHPGRLRAVLGAGLAATIHPGAQPTGAARGGRAGEPLPGGVTWLPPARPPPSRRRAGPGLPAAARRCKQSPSEPPGGRGGGKPGLRRAATPPPPPHGDASPAGSGRGAATASVRRDGGGAAVRGVAAAAGGRPAEAVGVAGAGGRGGSWAALQMAGPYAYGECGHRRPLVRCSRVGERGVPVRGPAVRSRVLLPGFGHGRRCPQGGGRRLCGRPGQSGSVRLEGPGLGAAALRRGWGLAWGESGLSGRRRVFYVSVPLSV